MFKIFQHSQLEDFHTDFLIFLTCFIHFSLVRNSLSSVQLLSYVWLFVNPCTSARQVSLSITNSQMLLKIMSMVLLMPFNHLILCCPLLLPTSIFPRIIVFSNEWILHKSWPKYWSLSFSISHSNIQDWFLEDWQVGSPYTPRDSQESSSTSQFKSINFSALSFHYSPTPTSIHDYWKNHSLD